MSEMLEKEARNDAERQAETLGLIKAHKILADFAFARPMPSFWGRRRANRDMQLLNELSDVLFIEIIRRRFDSILSTPTTRGEVK